MADQKKLVAEITSMDEDFTQWYTDVVIKAGLIAYSNIKGFMVYKPAGYALWEAVQKHLDARFKAVGVENVYLPMMIPENLLSKESDLVNGFAPEVAWVTHGGQEELQERICVRPTSETLFSDFYKDEVHSYRDLPKNYNQWCSVVRWEKETRPFLRSREFMWRGFLRGRPCDPHHQGPQDRQGEICGCDRHLYDRSPDARRQSSAVRHQPQLRR